MPSGPMVVVLVLLASLWAAVFHVIKGRALVELPVFWAASLIGAATGELGARVLGLNFFMIGELHPVEATIGSLVFLLVARWLKV